MALGGGDPPLKVVPPPAPAPKVVPPPAPVLDPQDRDRLERDRLRLRRDTGRGGGSLFDAFLGAAELLRAYQGSPPRRLWITYELVALDPARNIRRRYSSTASLDLFGMIVVETRWGRIGARGQAQARAFADRAAAERHIAATLSRRDTAESRIGVAYRPL